jgi:hypothetical protein
MMAKTKGKIEKKPAKKPEAKTAKKKEPAPKPAVAKSQPKVAKPAKPAEAPITQAMVAERAYHLWLAAGCPEGQETDLWLRAEAELCQENARP